MPTTGIAAMMPRRTKLLGVSSTGTPPVASSLDADLSRCGRIAGPRQPIQEPARVARRRVHAARVFGFGTVHPGRGRRQMSYSTSYETYDQSVK